MGDVNWGIQQFQQPAQLDLQPGIQNYFTGQYNQRENSLAELTMTKWERKQKRDATIRQIQQQNVGNPQGLIQGFERAGIPDEAQKARTSFQNQQTAIQQRNKAAFDQRQAKVKAFETKMDKHYKIYSKLPKGGNARPNYYMDYIAEDIKTETGKYPEEAWTAQVDQSLQARADALVSGSGPGEYGLKPIPVLNNKTGIIEYYQPKKSGGADKMNFGEGMVTLDPDLKYIKQGNKYSVKDMFNRDVGTMPIGVPTEKTPGYVEKVAGAKVKGTVGAEIQAGVTVSKAEETLKAKTTLTKSLVRMKSLYEDLRKEGGIVDTDNVGLGNAWAWSKSTGLGQGVQNAIGTKEQSIRNEIKAIKPNLINAVRKASGMGAKGMDSEKELEFFLQTVTDEKKDFQSNIAAIAGLDRALGLDIGMEITPDLQVKIDEIHAEYDRRKAEMGWGKAAEPKPLTDEEKDNELINKWK